MDFEIIEGATSNVFHRSEVTAAHLLAGGKPAPRLLVAFPGGNVGVGIWFVRQPGADLRVSGVLRPVRRDDRHGVAATVDCSRSSLTVARIALGNIRMLRAVDTGEEAPAEFAADVRLEDGALIAHRTCNDGAEDYLLTIRVEDGSIAHDGDSILLRSDGSLRLQIEALTSAPLLEPLEGDNLLGESAGSDLRAREVLAFLSYEDKLCAGSWRFLTYFGRDTLLTVRLMMPVLASKAIEAGLASVLERLSPDGRVAHEEALGDWSTATFGESPSYDWTMIDDDYMFSAVALAYFETERGHARAQAFLQRTSRGGDSYRALLARNLLWVWKTARPFAESGAAADLIRIDPRGQVGQWRDSQTGLAGGVYPWDVNVVLVPAALRAIAELGPEVLGDAMPDGSELQRVREAWRKSASLFELEIERNAAVAAIERYAQRYQLDAAHATGAVGKTLRFSALALRADGTRVPVMHSDVGYSLIFDRPSAGELGRLADLATRPFPAGLHTAVGIPISNPAFASDEEEAGLTPGHYHGACMWPWQHAMWILGLREQADRDDIEPALRQRLRDTADEVMRVATIEDLRTAELWTWKASGSSVEAVPFGQSDDHFAESNAAQLWSTVDLVLHPRSIAQS